MATVEPKVIKLPKVRLGFPHLKDPSTPKDGDGDPKFRACFILDPDDSTHKKVIKSIKKEAKRLIEEAFEGRRVKLKEIDCFGDGNDKISEKTGEIYDGFEDMFFVQANNRRRPKCILRNKDEIEQADIDKILYPGCYVYATVNLWIQDNKFGKAVRCSLRGVQFYADGEEFGSGTANIDKEFDDFDDEDYDLDDDDDDDDLDL